MEQSGSEHIRRKLEEARRELLDLSARNRLIHTPRRQQRSSSIEVIDEKAAHVIAALTGGRSMTFLPRPEAPATRPDRSFEEARILAAADDAAIVFDPALMQPEDDADALENGTAARHRDDRLQTGMTSAVLQKRLLRAYYAAQTFEQEQGISALYLAVGFLRWFESESSDVERCAPLVLIPVALERPSARAKFRLRWSGEDITTNLSLKEKLRLEFGLTLPDIPAMDDLDCAAYFEEVGRAVATIPRWEVLPDDMVLWFFSFAKLLMYRDLDAANWPPERPLVENRLIQSLLGDGFREEAPLCGEEENIDSLVAPKDMLHVVDADSSQAVVVEEVKRGGDRIVQGPPGTGKSQTIINMIAGAAAQGKRVLFVSEKMAALDVVMNRMIKAGLGDMCLALHSRNTNKHAVLRELEKVLALDRPRVGSVEETAAQLQAARDRLNAHALLMHTPVGKAGITPFRAVGELVRLREGGVAPADFALENAAEWTTAELEERAGIVRELAAFIEPIGVPAAHPFRGVMLEAMLPMDRDRLVQQLPAVIEAAGAARSRAAALEAMVRVQPCTSLHDAARLAALGQHVAAAPALDAAAFAHPVWDAGRADIATLVEAGARFASLRMELEPVVNDAAWSADVDAAQRDLREWGASIFRFLSIAFRRAQRTLRGLLRGQPPKPLAARLAILDGLIEARSMRKRIENLSEVGRTAFGGLWRGEDSDFSALTAIDHWDSQMAQSGVTAPGWRQIMQHTTDRAATLQVANELGAAIRTAEMALGAIVHSVQLDVASAFQGTGSSGGSGVDGAPLEEIIKRLEAWRVDPEALAKWIAYRVRHQRACAAGMVELAARLYDGRIPPDSALDQMHMAFHEAQLRAAMQAHPALAAFEGVAHERVLQTFRTFEAERMHLARQQVARAHYDGIPRGAGQIGEIGVVRGEIAKRTRHLPLRQLLKRAGNAVTRIKPVIMMSPLSIAQYVEPGALEFDLLIFDEASQVRPVDALGAAARAKQIVVVGDDKQLPPTPFFEKLLGDDDLDEYGPDEEGLDSVRTRDIESILGLCAARGLGSGPNCMLRWHYRSRHHSLIAVSNKEFYDSRLNVIPSPMQPDRTIGVVFHHVDGGVFDRGRTATNAVEAKRVAEAVLAHARTQPGASLGVGAFSVAQRDAILDELELLRRASPDTESFFVAQGGEPFFVKNLENIQGDERDVIYISVGYARDESGFMSMHFGPISNQGGERRLNVLITRARTRCEVFSSITASDIDLNRATGRGPAALKTYLGYAESGILDVGSPTNRGCDSVFEEAVAGALAAQGIACDAQVGVAGFFVDLAVKDPDQPGRYLLGIECDGAQYHRARSARDRDRLRQQVLEDRGWVIHRIWSTDWFNRPKDELQRTVAAIDRAKATLAAPTQGLQAMPSAAAPPTPAIEREPADASFSEAISVSVPYEEASFPVPRTMDIPDVPLARRVEIVRIVVAVEEPIHPDEVAMRIRTMWGLSRTGPRIARAVTEAITVALEHGDVVEVDGFLVTSVDAAVAVRNRELVESQSLRRPEMIPPAEIRACVHVLVREHLGVTRDQAVLGARHALGFQSTSAQFREVVTRELDRMVNAGALREDGGRLFEVH